MNAPIRIHFCTIVATVLLGVIPAAFGADIAEDSFNSYALGGLPGQDGGSGWVGPWQAGAGNTATVVDTGGAPLEFAPEGASPVEGGERAVELTGTGNQITAVRTLATPQTATFYVSYLARISAGNWTDTDTFGVHLGEVTTSTATLNFGTRGVNGGGGVWMVRTGTAAPVAGAFVNGPVAVGDVNFLVGKVSKLDADGNPTSTYDRMEVWLNPTLDDENLFPNGQYQVQLAPGTGLGTINHILIRIAALEAGDAIQVDELRVTAEWPLGLSPLPRISNITPGNRTSFVDPTGGISFDVSSPEPMASSEIELTVNGVDVTGNLTVTGSSTAWSAMYDELEADRIYTVEISASNAAGSVSRSIQFDTFAEDSFVIEAEDFNFEGGQFYDDPDLCNDPGGSFTQDCYFDRVGTPEIDTHETGGEADDIPAANYLDIYRWGPDFVERGEHVDTFTSSDVQRRKFAEAPPGAQGEIKDFDVTQIAAGDWLNYTRTFEEGNYNVYLRVRSGAAQQVTLSRVTNPTSTGQTAALLGGFNVPNTGGAYQFVPLTTASGGLIPVQLSGEQTLRLTASEAANNMQWNFVLFAPSQDAPAPAFIGTITPSDGAVDVAPDAEIAIDLVNASTTVNAGSIVLTVDGEDVTDAAQITSSGAGVSVRYGPGVMLPGLHTASISFQDSAGATIENDWQFSVVNVPVLPAAWAAPVGSGSTRGFNVRSVQVTDPTVAAALPRTLARVEEQLAGVVQADHSGTDTPLVINYKERSDIGDQGYFTIDNGFPDAVAQDIGLVSFDNHEHFAVEALFFAELQPGLVKLGVNANDTFRLSAGRAGTTAGDFPLVVGEWPGEGGATAAEPQYPANFIVTEPGVYAFRLIWAEYVGSSSVELHVKDADGVSHLLNDDTLIEGKASPILVYRSRTAEPPDEAPSMEISRNGDGSVTISWSGSGTLESAPAVTGPWNPVAGAGNPYTTTPGGTQFFRVAQ